jgi:hypothetical protein
VRETVTEGVTGTFFPSADASLLAEAVRRFDPDAIDPAECVRAAQHFDTLRFQDTLARIVDDALEDERSPRRPPQRPSGLALQPRRFSRRNEPTRSSGA